eukprot:PhM_4_TR16066/c0_g1_i1/m.42066/K16190/GLCAK; glucuronokinase
MSVCILLVAGHASLLEHQISDSPEFRDYSGVPKALLPSGHGNRVILDLWWEEIKRQHTFQHVFLVCNANKYKYFERWASANDFPVENIVNDGTTSEQHRLGAVADVELVMRTKNISKEHVIVISADMAFYENFDVGVVLQYFERVTGNVAVYYDMIEGETSATRGMLQVDDKTNTVTAFLEKPESCDSRRASVVFYCFKASVTPLLLQFAAESAAHPRSLGAFMEWLVPKSTTFALKLPTSFRLIGSKVGIDDYKAYLEQRTMASAADAMGRRAMITHRAYARVGLAGNPSDGYFGKTLSMTISNFWCEVTLTASDKLRLVPHPLHDPSEFGSLSDLHGISNKEGYLGGLRLLQATCKKFFEFCLKKGIALAKKNFTLRYDTNIPRQVGLAGSSSIVTATMRCLMEYFNIRHSEISMENLPNLILSVEVEELFIAAGLQDRVVQVYEGVVYMNFSKDLMDQMGHGEYERLVDVLPPTEGMFLVWSPDPSDSGKIHSDVKERWRRGDEDVVTAMKTFASFAEQARTAVIARDVSMLCDTMDANFDLRRSIFGDACLGHKNLDMIRIGRENGAAVKFPGSGGAVLGLVRPGKDLRTIRHAYERQGYVFVSVHLHQPGQTN